MILPLEEGCSPLKGLHPSLQTKKSKGYPLLFNMFKTRKSYFLFFTADWAAAKRAIGTRKGEQLT